MEFTKEESRPVTVYCDNEAPVTLAKNANGHSKIKHISMKAHWIREIVDMKEVLIAGISTEDNIQTTSPIYSRRHYIVLNTKNLSR